MSVQGPCRKFFQGSPPLLRGVQWERALVGLVDLVGAHRGQRWVIPGSPPRMGNSRETPKEACTRFPPLLCGVREERGRGLSGQVAQVGAHSDLVARCPPWRWEVRRQLFERFSPGDVGVPGSPQFFCQGSPPKVGVYKFLIPQGGLHGLSHHPPNRRP